MRERELRCLVKLANLPFGLDKSGQANRQNFEKKLITGTLWDLLLFRNRYDIEKLPREIKSSLGSKETLLFIAPSGKMKIGIRATKLFDT